MKVTYKEKKEDCQDLNGYFYVHTERDAYCPICHHKANQGYPYCPYCGTELEYGDEFVGKENQWYLEGKPLKVRPKETTMHIIKAIEPFDPDKWMKQSFTCTVTFE